MRISYLSSDVRSSDLLVPGHLHAAVESMTSFISNMMRANIGEEGRRFTPYVFSLFMFILFATLLGMLPLGLVGVHPFTFTSHLTATCILAILRFSIVLFVCFWRHTLHFFHFFVPLVPPLAYNP